MPLDDYLELSPARIQRVGVRLSGECSAPLAAALATHPALVLQGELTEPAGLSIYCGTDQLGQEGPALRISGSQGFSPLQGDIFWHPASGRLRGLSLDPAWLSAPLQGVPPSAGLVLLGTADRPLILFDARHNIIDVQLNLASPLLVRRPEYPLLISGLVDLLLGNESAQRDLVATDSASPASIMPQRYTLNRAEASARPVTTHVRNLVGELIIAALLLLILDLLLLFWQQQRQSRRVASVAGTE